MADESNVMQEALKEAQNVQAEKQAEANTIEASADGPTDASPIKDALVDESLSIESVSANDPIIDEHGRSYATGKRKDAVARVWIKPGSGKIQVNGRKFEHYFARPVLRMIINQPLEAVERKDHYDVNCTVKGGGNRYNHLTFNLLLLELRNAGYFGV